MDEHNDGGAPTERVVELVGIFADVAAPGGRSTATIIWLPSPCHGHVTVRVPRPSRSVPEESDLAFRFSFRTENILALC